MHGYGLSAGDAALLHARRRAVESRRPADLARVREPDVHLAIWTRSPDEIVSQQAEVAARVNASVLALCGPGDARADAESAARRAFASAGFEANALAADVARLVRLYADVSGERRIRMRLESEGVARAQDFHVDWLGLRLASSYVGAGTEWLPDHAADREALGVDPARACLDEGEIRRIPRFAVAILKGAGYPGNVDGGVIHRAPPSGESERLVLLVDAPRG